VYQRTLDELHKHYDSTCGTKYIPKKQAPKIYSDTDLLNIAAESGGSRRGSLVGKSALVTAAATAAGSPAPSGRSSASLRELDAPPGEDLSISPTGILARPFPRGPGRPPAHSVPALAIGAAPLSIGDASAGKDPVAPGTQTTTSPPVGAACCAAEPEESDLEAMPVDVEGEDSDLEDDCTGKVKEPEYWMKVCTVARAFRRCNKLRKRIDHAKACVDRVSQQKGGQVKVACDM